MLPKVAIVGRPNVGKSSLLNMLAGRRVSIVDPTAGVTRDRVSHTIELPPGKKGGKPRLCEMIDTGGYGVYSGEGELELLTDDIEHQIALALHEAHLILFVVDALSSITPLDQRVAKWLRERVGNRVEILLVANKVDDEKYESEALNAMQLGFGEPVTVSATTGRNKFELVDAIADRLDFEAVALEPEAEPAMLLAIVGKRNAGKSTFVNALAGSERVIASELPGTTRDSIDVRFQIGDKTFVAIDTAGVRKRKSLEGDIEYYSNHRALRSIRRADVVLLMIDATLPISQVDKKLTQEIQEHYKPCVIVLNKWDLVEDKLNPDDYVDYLQESLRGLDFAPVIFASAKQNDHVAETIELAENLYKQASTRVSTGELNQVMRDILTQRGPSSKLGRRAKIYYVTMPRVNPPTIVVFVNEPEMFDDRYQRYILNSFRERLPFPEVPIKLVIRPRNRREKPGEPIAEA